jgi:glucosamine 6-phosphate synthetase-like amidotransferase/phosphosugar isomerase protein
MCGIAGAINNGKGRLTKKSLRNMANGIEMRGRHAYGAAWVDSDNRVRMHKGEGPISKFIDGILDAMHDPRVVILHTRWTTHGPATRNENNHPHPCDGGWLVHNGQIPNYLDLIEEYGLLTSSSCDSEVLGLLIPEFSGTLLERVVETVNACSLDAPLCMGGIWANPTRLAVVKRGNPLFIGTGSTGNVYFSSCPIGLPGQPRPLEDSSAFVFTYGQGASSMEVEPYAPTGVTWTGSDSFDDDDDDDDDVPLWKDDEMTDRDRWRSNAVQNLARLTGDRSIIEHAKKGRPWGVARRKRSPG